MINTLNESKLHKTLKEIYFLQEKRSKKEVKVGNYIADIVTSDKNIIEIQTSNVSSLLAKIKYFLSINKSVTIVHPTAKIKYIETKDNLNSQVKLRKSPLKKDIYSVFKQFTGLISIIPNKNLKIEILEITMTEERITTSQPVQTRNNRRRYKKNWLKSNKRLESIDAKYTFRTSEDWISLIPYSSLDSFTLKELHTKIKQKGSSATENDVRILLWFYKRIGLIEPIGKTNKSIIYRIKN